MPPFIHRYNWTSDAARSVCEETGLADPVAAIRQLVDQLIADTQLPRPHTKLAIPASIQGIRQILEVPMIGAGMLVPGLVDLEIHVNRSHSPGRRNFTICHEITHTLIPSYWDGIGMCLDEQTGGYDPDQEEECLCDIGAAELLMPRAEFQKEVHHTRFRVWTIEKLASEFGASREAAAIRAVELSERPVALLVWAPLGKPANSKSRWGAGGEAAVRQGEQLQLRYGYSNLGPEWAIPRGVVAPPGSNPHDAYVFEGSKTNPFSITTDAGELSGHAESLGLSYIVGEAYDRKVFTLLFPDGPP